MDPANTMAPLFEAYFELREPDLVFVPPLDSNKEGSFATTIQNIINDILQMGTLVHCIKMTGNCQTYMVIYY